MSQIYITNNAGKKYIFTVTGTIEVRHVSTNISINSPGQGSEENYVINLNGVQKVITIGWQMANRGSADAADSTHTSSVLTIGQQWIYWDQHMITGSFEEEYTLYWELDSDVLLNDKCLIEDFSMTSLEAEPTTFGCTLTLTRGQNPYNITGE